MNFNFWNIFYSHMFVCHPRAISMTDNVWYKNSQKFTRNMICGNINHTLIKKSSNDKTMRKLCIIEKIWYYIRFNNNYSIIQTIFKITTSCIIMNKPPWQVRCTNIARDKIKENIFCVIFKMAWSSARLPLSTINIYLNNYMYIRVTNGWILELSFEIFYPF